MASTVDLATPASSQHRIATTVFYEGFLGLFLYALTKQLDEVEEFENQALLQAARFRPIAVTPSAGK